MLNIAIVTGCPAESSFSLIIANSSTPSIRCSHSLINEGNSSGDVEGRKSIKAKENLHYTHWEDGGEQLLSTSENSKSTLQKNKPTV